VGGGGGGFTAAACRWEVDGLFTRQKNIDTRYTQTQKAQDPNKPTVESI